MTASTPIVKSKGNISNHEFTMSADSDELILSAHGAKNITVSVNGITADEIKAYGSAFNDPAKLTDQIFNSSGLNPFTTDGTHPINDANISKIKFVRVGAVDGVITVAVNFQR